MSHNDNKKISHGLKKILTKKILFLILVIATSHFFVFFNPRPVLGAEISKSEIISLINEKRIKHNLSPLSINANLEIAAQNKSEYLINNNYFAHNTPDGKQFSSWIKDSGYKYSLIGENLAMNFNSSKSAFNAWMKSQSHRDNILDPNFTEIGIGLNQKNKQNMIVVIFGRSDKLPLSLELTIGSHISEIFDISKKIQHFNTV